MSTNRIKTVALPVISDGEVNAKFIQYTAELSERLLDTVTNWLTEYDKAPAAERPGAFCIGAASYAAVKMLIDSLPEGDLKRDAIQWGYLATLIRNDEKFKLAISTPMGTSDKPM